MILGLLDTKSHILDCYCDYLNEKRAEVMDILSESFLLQENGSKNAKRKIFHHLIRTFNQFITMRVSEIEEGGRTVYEEVAVMDAIKCLSILCTLNFSLLFDY